MALPLVYTGLRQGDRLTRAREVLVHIGLSNQVDQRPHELSGGQRQRVAIARALVHQPSTILADEPTGNLDTQTSHEIMGLLDELHAKGDTIILVTHEEDIARYTRTLVRLRDGEVKQTERIK